MARYVVKFGGSSVADIDRLTHVAEIVKSSLADGHELVVVVSAMGGETDRLLRLIQSISLTPDSREYAACVASGEQISSALTALMLQQHGLSARSVNAFQMQLRTELAYRKSHIQSVNRDYIESLLAQGVVPVVTGFQGINADNDLTTLGRGGSDTTAVALAAFLEADECRIYTDVDGVYSGDPRLITNAVHLDMLTYDEMLAYASSGAKVLQTQSVELARKYDVAVRVLSSFAPAHGGTLLTPSDPALDHPVISGVAAIANQVKVTLQPLSAAELSAFDAHLVAHQIDVDMRVNDSGPASTVVSMAVHEDDLPRLCQFTDDLHVESKLAKVALVGQRMQLHAGLSAEIMQLLLKREIQIHAIASDMSQVSILIEMRALADAVKVLHHDFIETVMSTNQSK